MRDEVVALIRQPWFDLLDEYIQSLLRQAIFLLDREQNTPQDEMIVSYGYLIFTAGKAYEGFLKDYFLTSGFISEQLYYDDYFRIGRALNPDLPRRLRDEYWIFDDVARGCGGPMAKHLWRAWSSCRNHVFHYRQDSRHITIEDAEACLLTIIQAMRRAIYCQHYDLLEDQGH